MSDLSVRKRRAINSLLLYGSITAAADACGVSRQTIRRWMDEPEFTAVLRLASTEQVEQASRRLVSLVDEAVSVLEKLLSSKSEHQRRLAADSVLSHALKLRELVELEQRITNLERNIGDKR